MKQPTYTMQRIALANCKPHADAEAYSASSDDRKALANSIGESGVLSPIAVVPSEDGKGYYVIDGIGRMNAMVEAGVVATDAQVFDLGDLSVAEFVVCKNAMMRKVTTGTRILSFLKCHEVDVLAAADPEKYARRPGNEKNFKGNRHAQSHDCALEKGWSSREIAERIGVSDKDVLAGIELLKAMSESAPSAESAGDADAPERVLPEDLLETWENVLRGETPIRRWKAAAGGKVSKVGGKAAADYAAIGWRTMKSLKTTFENWKAVPYELRANILRAFADAVKSMPEDFRDIVGNQ